MTCLIKLINPRLQKNRRASCNTNSSVSKTEGLDRASYFSLLLGVLLLRYIVISGMGIVISYVTL